MTRPATSSSPTWSTTGCAAWSSDRRRDHRGRRRSRRLRRETEGQAARAALNKRRGLALDARGNLYVADAGNDRVRRVRTDGRIETVAGNGVRGFSGDGGPADRGQLDAPHGLAMDPAGRLLIADWRNQRVRRVDLETGLDRDVRRRRRRGHGPGGHSRDRPDSIGSRHWPWTPTATCSWPRSASPGSVAWTPDGTDPHRRRQRRARHLRYLGLRALSRLRAARRSRARRKGILLVADGPGSGAWIWPLDEWRRGLPACGRR